MINCKVCQSMINIEGKTHQHVVKCTVCNEATVSIDFYYHTVFAISWLNHSAQGCEIWFWDRCKLATSQISSRSEIKVMKLKQSFSSDCSDHMCYPQSGFAYTFYYLSFKQFFVWFFWTVHLVKVSKNTYPKSSGIQ